MTRKKKTPQRSSQSPASSSNSTNTHHDKATKSDRRSPQDSFSPALNTISGHPISFRQMWFDFRRQEGQFKHIHQQRKLVLAALLEERVENLVSAFSEGLDLFQVLLRPSRSSEPSLVSILVPLAKILSSAEFSNSTQRTSVNKIYATVFASDPPFLPTLLSELEKDLRRFPQTPHLGVDESNAHWKPTNWSDVVLPVIALFARIFRSVADARGSADAPGWVDRVQSVVAVVVTHKGADVKGLNNAIKNLAQTLPQQLSHPLPQSRPHPHPQVSRQPGPSSSSSSNVQPPSEGPGKLRESKIARHRNDHIDFRRIQVLPVEEELISPVSEYLPREGDPFLPEGMEGHLARIFRLFREDMISLLRDAVKFFLKDVWPKRGPNLNIRQHDAESGVTLTIFTGCDLKKPDPSLSSALRVSFSFPQPWMLPGSHSAKEKQKMRQAGVRKDFWQGPQGQRFWQEGSIVIIVPEGDTEKPSLQLAVVCNRDIQSLIGSEDRGEIHLEMIPMTDIRSSDQGLFPRAFLPALRTSGNKPSSFTLFQVGKHFFRGYESILVSLQLHVAGTVPFAELMIGTKELNDIPSPSYIVPDHTYLNLTPIMARQRPLEIGVQEWSHARKNLKRVPVVSTKQLSDHLRRFLPHLCLDLSQIEALSHALTHQLTLIVGPPGCGKSYIGVRLVCVLLHNLKNFAMLHRFRNIGGIVAGQIQQRSSGSLKPIVCLCYTNHALDQFLEDLMDAGIHNIVRVGSRSKSERVMARSLFTLCRDSRLNASDYQREKKLQVKCTTIQQKIEQTWQCIETLTGAQKIGSLLQALKPIIEEDEALFATIFTPIDEEGFQIQSKKPASHRFLNQDGKRLLRAHLKNWRLSEDQLGMTSVEAIAVRSLREIFPQTSDEQLLNVLRVCDGKISRATEHLFGIQEQEEELLPHPIPSSSQDISLPSSSTESRVDPIQRERARTIFELIREYIDLLLGSLDDHLRDYASFAEELMSYRNLRRLQVLQAADIIGVTTTGASMHNSLLRSLRAAVLIVEEAGEVFESHLIASLSEHTQHLIMIGDHKQLRPKCAVHELSRDSKQGYDLDVSLFERLALRNFPLATLETQRRMHPEISNLIRRHLYPQLIDHQSVCEHPPVRGLQHRLWMFDVKGSREGQSDKGGSYENVEEAKMVIALVRHLVKQDYQPDQVVVLTPYVGQLLRLNALLAKENIEIVIDERSQAEIDGISIEAEELNKEQEEEHEEEDEYIHGKKQEAKKPLVRSTNLRTRVRLATVDNFQGEEADVVILSTVRNNPRGRLGFLKSDNRVNVMLSRARHGMVIFASVETVSRCRAAEASLFMDCIRQLQDQQRIGSFLPARCSNHGTFIPIKTPQDFALLSPDGGCGEPCRFRLECGHICTKSCHSDDREHVAVKCNANCMRLRPKCSHPCTELCYIKPCPPCQELVETTLACGHTVQAACYLVTSGATILCPIEVEVALPFCQHQGSLSKLLCSRYQRSVEAYEKKDWMAFVSVCSCVCTQPCHGHLACGHTCQENCGDCMSNTLKTLETWDLSVLHHLPCAQKCDRDQYCGHRCPGICHASPADCGLCTQACLNRCSHSQCPLRCNDLCAPCAEPCQWGCPHIECPLPCSVPCTRLPCDARCDQVLPCGHRCPTVCGEPCPSPEKYCRECAKGSWSSQVVDLLEGTTLADHDPDVSPLVILGCGHALTIESADGTFEMSSVYEQSASGWSQARQLDELDLKPTTFRCPHCRASLNSVRRYGRILNHLGTQHCDRRFAIFSADEVIRLSARLRSEEEALREYCASIKPERPSGSNKKGARPNKKNTIGARRTAIFNLQSQIKKLSKKVKDCSSTQVYKLALASLNRQGQRSELTKICPPVKSNTLPESLALFASVHILSGCSFLIDPNSVKEPSQIVSNCFRLKIGLKLFAKAEKEAIELKCHRALSKIRFQIVDSVCLIMYCTISRGFDHSAFSEYLPAARNALTKVSDTPQFWSSPTILEETRDRFMRLQKDADIATLREVFKAMGREVGTNNSSTFGGHWFTCPNGHIYTIGECGGAMQASTCPECGAVIGGGSHTLATGNQRATEFLQQMEPSSSSS